jgi:hypothetical protein
MVRTFFIRIPLSDQLDMRDAWFNIRRPEVKLLGMF